MMTETHPSFKSNCHVINPPSTACGDIVIHDHDVLSGRGVGIAQHPGNERFRTLISTSYSDKSYCTMYSVQEKKALAKEIIAHIENLNPPGRFLKRDNGKSTSLNRPWKMLLKKEALKKTAQAVRDCNRSDRSEYAVRVVTPFDVAVKAKKLSESRLTIKQRAKAAVKTVTQDMPNSDPLNRRCTTSTPQHIHLPIEAQRDYVIPFVDGEVADSVPLLYAPLEGLISAEHNDNFFHSGALSHQYAPSPFANFNAETHNFTVQNQVHRLLRHNELYFHPTLYD